MRSVPPKVKYTREEIIEAAFQIARERGIEAVVARELAKKLGTSSSPIFTAFHNMEELQQEIRKLAMKEFEAFINDAVNYVPPFKWVGLKMIQFAMKEPKLFQLLYMQEHEESQRYEDMVGELGETVEVCLQFMERDYALTRPEAELLFKQVWLHTFGICVLVAAKVCHFTQQEISEMLSLEFQGALMLIKSGRFQVVPVNEKEQLQGSEKPVSAMDIIKGSLS
ncbi:MAG: TetR/AcrR family transcriptional regulator [Lachnospiraceae bacterium]|nr:TetR/AcrR family transcriptional regulator [Lachnospiraceae bacterium]